MKQCGTTPARGPAPIHAGLGLLVSVLLASAAGAQKPQFTFRASTQLVQINVIVDGKTGPVAGLSADDFTVTDNGKPRPVQVFS
ncbi:MAG: hypothetical protein ACRD1E_12590, partial [Terriglobales bacterium]